MPHAALLSNSLTFNTTLPHANTSLQAKSSLAPFNSRPAVANLHGRKTRRPCAAESSSSDQQSSAVKDEQAAKQRAEQRLEQRKRKDRNDLFTDNWGGDVWKGSKVNVLSIILAVSILVPLGGLIFAYLTFGTLWG